MAFGGLRRLRGVAVRDGVHAIAAGIICYGFGASVNFYALTLIDASVERALLFSYPAMVVMILWVVSGNRPRPVTTIAVLATWVGIALTVGLFDQQLLQQNLLGAAWVLVCSVTIAYYFLVSARLTHSMGSAQFTVVAMTAAAIVLAARYEWRHDWFSVSLDATTWLWMLALVIFVTVLPLYLVAEGVRRVGAQRGAIASTLGPPSAAILAIVVLGETVSASQFIGIALIVGGIASLELRSRIAPP